MSTLRRNSNRYLKTSGNTDSGSLELTFKENIYNNFFVFFFKCRKVKILLQAKMKVGYRAKAA